MKTTLCLAFALLAAACVSQEPLTGTDPGPWLRGAAGREPVSPATYSYDDPSAALLWPDPLPPPAFRGIEPEVTARGTALPGGEAGTAELSEEYAEYDEIPYGGGEGRWGTFHRPRRRPAGEARREAAGDGGTESPRKESPREAGPDAPPERRDRARRAPDRPGRTDPRSPPRRPR